MDNKRIVVALGRNAFGKTFPEQQQNVKKAAVAIADLVEAKYQVVITHSNGPQVGMIQTAMTEFARLDPDDRTVAPMSVCGAMSEGYIGYDLQNAIREELINRGIYKTVSTIITQVRVDPFDIAFSEPSKIIGRYMTKEEAEAEEEKGIDIEPKVEITYDDFMKMQFQVGEIISCEAVPKSKKLLCSQVKIGSQVKQIVSGIRKYYTPEEMVGKKVMVLVNLKPAKLAGVLSEGMLLCAEDAEGNLALMTPEKAMPSGAEIC